MRIWFSIILCLVFNFGGWAQKTNLAKTFFDAQEYHKALHEYNLLLKKQPTRTDFIFNKLICLQELGKFSEAESFLLTSHKKAYDNPQFLIELGYNSTLQGHSEKANSYYQQAIDEVVKKPNYASLIGGAFEKHNLLQWAKKAFLEGKANQSQSNLDFQLAGVYGQLNEIDEMFNSYLSAAEVNSALEKTIQRYIGQFISDNAESDYNKRLRVALLKKLQSNPNVLWNRQLSWLFVQQKEYEKAFRQEKAIYNRSEQLDLVRFFSLAALAKNNSDLITASEIYEFVLSQTQNLSEKVRVHEQLLLIAAQQNENTEKLKEDYIQLFNEYGKNNTTIVLQLNYAAMVAFKLKDTDAAIGFLTGIKENQLSKFNQARHNMLLADILTAQGKFNQALIYYTKVQRSLKNTSLAQLARFKVAKTSYFKKDFKWALQQVKVLKESTSQLIANDAIALSLLISDHFQENEETLPMALDRYAEADFLAYQGETQAALAKLNFIISNYKGQPIEDEAYYLQAQLLEKNNEFDAAIVSYNYITQNLSKSIYLDNALYNLALLYMNYLSDDAKAQDVFGELIFNHPDSIHFVEAQKYYRKLRGDAI